MTDKNAVEIVTFRLNEGVSREDFLIAVAETQPVIDGFNGYIKRQLIESDSGQWIDLVWWATLDDALTAAEAIMTEPRIAPFGSKIDPDSVTMLHGHPVTIQDS
ncbi:MAG: antibiotic biosynthesis monooxygenase family protein [Aggregatilineales bacterium]